VAPDDLGVPVDELVATVKDAIKAANISATDSARDLAVTSVYLKLNTVATVTLGGSLDFRIPFAGLRVKLGETVTRVNTHVIELTLVPEAVIPTRDAAVEGILVDAIETVRSVMSRAAAGDDPFVLRDGAVELEFGVTSDGSISLVVDAGLKDDITHTLRVSLGSPE
jgi:hypothetical protein